MITQPLPSAGPPLDWPQYGIGFVPAIKRAFRKYATFSGRAGRGEYWWWILFTTLTWFGLAIVALVLGTITSPDGGDTPGWAGIPFLILLIGFGLAAIVPSIAVTLRRLHDAGFSGWLYLLILIPTIGGLIVSVLCLLPTSPLAEKYGPPPALGHQPPAGYPPPPER